MEVGVTDCVMFSFRERRGEEKRMVLPPSLTAPFLA